MNLSADKARLAAAVNEVSLKWHETTNYWRDARSREFEKQYLRELLICMDKTVTVIEKLDEVLKKIQRECE